VKELEATLEKLGDANAGEITAEHNRADAERTASLKRTPMNWGNLTPLDPGK
jgi:hypothetical protein